MKYILEIKMINNQVIINKNIKKKLYKENIMWIKTILKIFNFHYTHIVILKFTCIL